jgi:multidrug resistance efflux pump
VRRRTVLIGGGAAAAAIVVAAVLVLRAGGPPAAPAARTPDIPTMTVTYGAYTEQVVAVGRVGAPAGGDAKLTFAGSGIVRALDVHVGDRVDVGTPLAELDSGGLTLDAAQARDEMQAAAGAYGGGSVTAQAGAAAQAHLAAARAKLASLTNAKIQLDTHALTRAEALYAGGVAAAKDVEAARQQLDVDRADAVQARADVAQAEADVRTARAQGQTAQAQLAAAQAKLAAAGRNVSNASLRSPMAGVVTAIFKHVGEAVDPSQPVLTIGPPSSDTITLSLTGTDARRIAVGESVAITDSASGATGSGVVRAVVPSVDPATQMSTVVVAGVPLRATAGDAVEARIAVGTRRGVVIPTTAIVDDPQTGAAIVFVRSASKSGNGFTARTITVAAGDVRQSLVASGLRAGEQIATEGAYDLLAPGGD